MKKEDCITCFFQSESKCLAADGKATRYVRQKECLDGRMRGGGEYGATGANQDHDRRSEVIR